jgi:hypothetical protein
MSPTVSLPEQTIVEQDHRFVCGHTKQKSIATGSSLRYSSFGQSWLPPGITLIQRMLPTVIGRLDRSNAEKSFDSGVQRLHGTILHVLRAGVHQPTHSGQVRPSKEDRTGARTAGQADAARARGHKLPTDGQSARAYRTPSPAKPV